MRTHTITAAKITAAKFRSVTLSRVAVGTVCLVIAALSGCAESLPVSALPSRDQFAKPVLDKAAQQKAMNELIRERDERQARIALSESAAPTKP